MKYFIEFESTSKVENGKHSGYLTSEGTLSQQGEDLTRIEAFQAFKKWAAQVNWLVIKNYRMREIE